ncbi:MAG TPA: gluconeogenesis factor YvcK family protein [Candidatus Saccharimonadales bacterium]|nr:gluconeogenesis factor YvcK family protein [Candidatus Saccharimonadales bacterium]
MPTLSTPTRIVVIGGGTGSFTLLQSFKNYFSDLTALVNMADNGGSSGVLRDELGVLPPGDVRQCLVALSDSPELRALFDYRFKEGGLKGHTLGNILLSALEKTTGDFGEAVKTASKVLRIHGQVLPITTTNTHLSLRMKEGRSVTGEISIAHMDLRTEKQPELSLDPIATINPEAKKAILQADVVVIAPGNLYGSLAPALLVGGVGRALRQAKATVVYICNLVTKPQQTDDFEVSGYVSEIERFAGNPIIDYVLYNTARPADKLLAKYVHEGEFLVGYDKQLLKSQHYQAIGLPLIDQQIVKLGAGDTLSHRRSLIRHDANAVAEKIQRLVNNNS